MKSARNQHGTTWKSIPVSSYANHLGEPAGLKNASLHDLDTAFETCNELIAGGWTEVTNQFQESTWLI